MNAPLPESIRKALETVTLDDKYALETGRAFMSGVQALVRLPMLQKKRDALFGLNTAGFVSGYRGSPLGGYDQALWAAKKHLAAQSIVFQPGVNEELAATAVWGTQQLELYPQSKEIDESSASVAVDPDRVDIILPEDFQMPPGGLHIRWPDPPLEQEARLMDYKWYAALAYVRANRLNHNVIEGRNDRFGIIASGKA